MYPTDRIKVERESLAWSMHKLVVLHFQNGGTTLDKNEGNQDYVAMLPLITAVTSVSSNTVLFLPMFASYYNEPYR